VGELTQAFEQPHCDVVQRLNITLRQLMRDTISNLPSFLRSLVIVGILGDRPRGALSTWAQHTEGDSSTEILIARLGYGGVWVIGSVVALRSGLDFGAYWER